MMEMIDKALNLESSHRVAAINDDLALQVDKYLSLLGRDEPTVLKVLLLKYVGGLSYREISSITRVGRTEVFNKIQVGLASLAASFRIDKGVVA